MDSSTLTNKRRARVIFADAILRNEAERQGTNTTRVIQGPGNTGADYSNWAINAAAGAVFTTPLEEAQILLSGFTPAPQPIPCSQTVTWTLSPDLSGWLTLTYVDAGTEKYYETAYATIDTTGSVSPQFAPPPVFISEIKLSISNGIYTVRFVVPGPLSTRKFNQNTDFDITCPSGTTNISTQLHLSIL